jgi:hypothetical protein
MSSATAVTRRRPVRVYEVFSLLCWYSNVPGAYHDRVVQVAAKSLKHALWLAGHDRWIDPDSDPLTGIVYRWENTARGHGRTAWCGTRSDDLKVNPAVQHGDSHRKIRAAVATHKSECTRCEERSLAGRLRRAARAAGQEVAR